MGRIRFTLTNILFWVIIVLFCSLSELFQLYGSQTYSSGDLTFIFVASFFIIGLMAVYYIFEHRKNKLTIDYVLLPALIIFGAIMIWTIFRQGDRTFGSGSSLRTVTFTTSEKLSYALQAIIWMSALYMVVFVHNKFGFNNHVFKMLAKAYWIIIVAFAVVDIIVDFNFFMKLFTAGYGAGGTKLFYRHSNIWAMALLVGVICSFILLQDGFKWHYFISIIFLSIVSFSTRSSTVTIVCFFVSLLSLLFELIANFKKKPKKLILLLGIGIVAATAFILLTHFLGEKNVPFFGYVLSFYRTVVSGKDYSTFTGRTNIWRRLIKLLAQDPLDLIFGLGYRTGNKLFASYISASERIHSAHNGVMEIFLRHGLLGASIYFVVGLISFLSFISYIRHKKYRKAFIYCVSFMALTAHNFTESTTILTPNTQGMFLTMVLILPLLNTKKQQKLNFLKEDLISYTNNPFNPKPADVLGLVSFLLVGGVSASLATITLGIINVIAFASCLTALIVIMIINGVKYHYSVKNIFSYSFLPMTLTLIFGIIVSLILKHNFEINLIWSILLLIVIFGIYILLLILLNKRSKEYLEKMNGYGLSYYKEKALEEEYR